MNEIPNYSEYSLSTLKDVLKHIDKERFPDRVKIIEEEIKRKSLTATKKKSEPIEEYPENWPNYKSIIPQTISLTTEEIIAFVDGEDKKSSSHKYYLGKWKKILEGKSDSAGFNWSAFFVGTLWFLYRKLFKAAVILFVFENIIAIFLSVVIYIRIYDKQDSSLQGVFFVYWIILILIRIFVGFIANGYYIDTATKIIKKARVEDETSEKNNKLKQLSSNGGTSILAVFIGVLINLIVYILESFI